MDGLEAEREQGITIDVAYRYFSTPNRSFIVADCPGHEQYTRNMATGASNCDLAILLVDARKGLLVQTHRHATIVSLLGVRHVALAVNKMDLVGYDQAVFEKIVADFKAASATLDFKTVTPIPVSARRGDNMSGPSEAMGWYKGADLLSFLETADVEDKPVERPFRFPVNGSTAPISTSAAWRERSPPAASPPATRSSSPPPARKPRSRASSQWTAISHGGGAATSVTLVFADEIDASRGDLLCDPGNRPQVADQFAAPSDLDERGQPDAGPVLPAQIGGGDASRPASPRSNTSSMSRRRRRSRRRRWA